MISSTTSTEIICTTPPSSTETKYDVIVTDDNKSDSFDGFTYDASSTPTVTSMNPITSYASGGGDLTITGTAFGNDTGSVKLCDKPCEINSWTDTQIVCIIPENKDSECSPVIEIPDLGYAGVNNVSPFTYRFRITGKVIKGVKFSREALKIR